ncbi:PD-(D/E)XK nuclease family protein [Nocardioides cavernae]|uniref:PD-(D/E)XK nuclease family protein n=1 Tax=Nocardioides TaxID=1839 RepID=UPI000B2A5446|nr:MULTISPECIES: PD-(D/E)XK nuclease family protein [Nocardioides]MCK9822866.1 PD-(D/E)XK nuclease family protein [Nocardioides cavernae]
MSISAAPSSSGDSLAGSPADSPAERVSTPVDGVDVLGALSPSRAGDFMACPLMYRFRTIDKLPEEPSPDAVRGTVVHKVLEDLFDLPAPDRTPDRAADMLVPAWDALLEAEPGLAEMFSGEGPDVASWLASCRTVLARYFDLEDPRRLEPAERELYVEALLDSRLLLRGFVDRIDVAPDGRVRVVDYKGLALDTPLPTPTGWTTMADVAVGDELLGRSGRATRVVAKSQVHHRPCYRVSFKDGSSVVADNVHLWRVVTSRRQQQVEDVISTESLARELAALRADGRPSSLWVSSASPLVTPDVELPIDPWLLGAWLGDGDCANGGLTVGKKDLADTLVLVKAAWDKAVLVREEQSAFRVTPSKDPSQCTFGHDEFRPATVGHQTRRCAHEELHRGAVQVNLSLSGKLRREGLLHNKHIPRRFLRSGTEQRIALLRGLMDTDGWWNTTRRRAWFTTTDDTLARDVVELMRTLGINPCHSQKPYTNAVRNDRTWHVIEFTPSWFNPFSLPRKALASQGAITPLQQDLSSRRVIARVDQVASVPTQCVAVDAPDSMYLCGEGFIPTHNTGRSPSEGFEAKALFQMKFYALVIWRLRGIVPSVLQLIYLGNGEIVRYEPDEDDLRATERKVEAIWTAIQLAQQTGDWRPSPSRLCDWCSYHQYCPTKGGVVPPLPVRPAPVRDVSTDESTD